MRRRDFLRAGTVICTTTAIAGCNTGGENENNTTSETPAATPDTETQTNQGTDNQEQTQDENDQQTEEDPETAVRYFFDDQTGALAHLGDEEIPENYDNTITNDKTESEYQEMQRNDRVYPEGMEDGQLTMTVDQMINRAEEIYNNPTQEFDSAELDRLGINLEAEDDEITFTRSLIRATQEAGVNSSGLADDVVANIAEDAIQQLDLDFENFKLSTLRATESISASTSGHVGGVRETDYGREYGNPGFRHMAGLLQYQKNGETKVKYAEQTDALGSGEFFHVIRDPEDSIYTADIEDGPVNINLRRHYEEGESQGSGTRFPEHYVTVLDYDKARQLESMEENFLDFGENRHGVYYSLGDSLALTMLELVDDRSINNIEEPSNPDVENYGFPVDAKLINDSFGQSLMDYRDNPTSEKREHLENVARGMWRIHQEEGWDTSYALTGTLEDPVFRPTDQETINEIRRDEDYNNVVDRVTG